MWIVRLALRRPYTFVVMSLLIVALGVLAILRMPADIFPEINIPVVSVIWSYSGISPEEMAEVVTIRCERSFTTNVNDIEHMESESLPGLSIIKLFFHPNAKVEAAVAQLAASSQAVLHSMPTGMTPPAILRYNASSVPILQLSISSDTMPEQALYDYGYNFIRTQMATIQGASFPLPYGGKPRQIMVDLNPRALYSQGLSATDVVTAINSQSLIIPSGEIKIGSHEYTVKLNSLPEVASAFNNLPIKQVNGTTIYVRDVASVRDGYAVQKNIVRHNGSRGALLTVLKNGGASTLEIVSRLKAILPRIRSTLPPGLKLTLLFDQSIFVRAAISGVLKEATTAALLTALMILLFIGSWRSTIIVCVSIPLSILTSLAILHLLNETINVMTLGGLALAVGILVDDATVEIENIHRNLAQGKPILQAILDGAQQIATPAFVSTLCICIVFVPVIFLTGAARYLFTPLAMAVVLAMMASYLLSRTLVPTMIKYLLGNQPILEEEEGGTGLQPVFVRAHHAFNRQFHRLRAGYTNLLAASLEHRKLVAVFFLCLCVVSAALAPFIGADFFPQVDAGQIRLHVRAPAGTRLEETESYFAHVEDSIRQVIPARELSDILDNIGLPYSGQNIASSDSVTIGPFDGEILVSLKPGDHHSTWDYVRQLRTRLDREYPHLTFFFQPADIVGQILNFGLPAPIDVQVIGPLTNAPANYRLAKLIERRLTLIPGAVDVHLHQVVDVPEMRFNVDRTRADQLALTQKDVADSLLVSLASSTQTSPNYWINPQNGVDYPIAVQTPQYRMDSTAALMNTSVRSIGGTPQLLANVASLQRGTTVSVVNHYNVQPLYDIFANVQDRDLGGVAGDVSRVLKEFTPKLPKGSFVEIRGQVQTMKDSFFGLGVGLLFAILLVYFVMVVNFQSWLDPFIILMALPGALSGILITLFLTQTTISVPSLMGAIMSIGVATANSILLVNFANDLREEGADAKTAALEAGYTRLRPVLMTALAMIVGMLPMAIGWGEGGEQNAPLGRAVIGGLILATVATLFFVPVVYSKVNQIAYAPVKHERRLPTGATLLHRDQHCKLTHHRSRANRARTNKRPLLTFFAVLSLIVLIAIAAGLPSRLHRNQTLQTSLETTRRQLPIVNVTAVRQAPTSTALELPGDLQAMIESPIFARADGYLAKRYVDIGDRVRKGQVLAELETPELDQQILQARATVSNAQSTLQELQAALALAEANLKLAQKTNQRWGDLEKRGTVSHQEADEKSSTVDVRTAEVQAARAKIASARDLVAADEANVHRLEQMKSYSRVTAPFDGMITARLVDIGTLINSGNGGSTKEMFRVAEVGTMRIFVNVPQTYVSSIKSGQPAELRVQELPGQVFQALVNRFTHEVDAGSRSMLAVLRVPNPRGILLPGMYAQVRFATARTRPAVLIPGDALVLGSKGPRVATVDSDNRVHFREIRIGNDTGNEVEVLSGLAPGDLVVMNPTDAVRDGVQVETHK